MPPFGFAVVLLCASFSAAEPPKEPPKDPGGGVIRAQFFGEVPDKPFIPTPDQDDYMAHWGQQEAPKPDAELKPPPEDRPADARPDRPVAKPIGGLVGARRRAQAPVGEDAAPVDDPRYRLWEGLNTPLSLPADKAAGATPAQALAQGRTDYNTAILGDVAAGEDGSAAGVIAPAGPEESPQPGVPQGLFVALDIDGAQSPGEYRDAVARLTQSAGFAADARFPPAPSGPDGSRVRVWGRLPGERLQEALRAQSVKRLEIQPGPRPGGDGTSRSEMLVALRVPQSAVPEEIFGAAVGGLAARTGFVLTRAIGVQSIPRSRARALVVSGRVPARSLGKVLGDPSVVKVMPAPPAPAPRGGLPSASRFPLFFSYAADRHPVLFLFALLAARALVEEASLFRRRPR